MTNTIYFCHLGGDNAGDVFCDPSLYYPFDGLHKKKVTLEEAKQLHSSVIIFGGGGILDTNSKMNNYYKSLNDSNAMFHWGSGSNSLNVAKIDWNPGEDEIRFEKDILNNFVIVGRRDYNTFHGPNHLYVPCVSCKLKSLKLSYDVKRRIGIVQHMWLQQINGLDYPTISMDLRNYKINEIIKFIGESEIIVTGSYHAAYWGLLLRKKVIINGNWSSKFDTLKYKPTLLSDDIESDIKKSTIPPENYMEECIQLNHKFYENVLTHIKCIY